jgi:hypothetical protein
MEYSQGQLRKTVGLSVEAYRHWKRVLPPISSRKGHTAKFLIGDILAVTVLKRLTDVCSINVGNLSNISEVLFKLCRSASLDDLEKLILQIDLKNDECKAIHLSSQFNSSDIFIIVPLAALVMELRTGLLETRLDGVQKQLGLSVEPVERNNSTRNGFN